MPVDSKFTIENTLSSIFKDPRVTLRYNTTVLSLIIENNNAKGVIYQKEGKNFEVGGDIIALGGNAIFNAHILLASGDKSYYTGRDFQISGGHLPLSISMIWITWEVARV